jgi:hypothetical protein
LSILGFRGIDLYELFTHLSATRRLKVRCIWGSNPVSIQVIAWSSAGYTHTLAVHIGFSPRLPSTETGQDAVQRCTIFLIQFFLSRHLQRRLRVH